MNQFTPYGIIWQAPVGRNYTIDQATRDVNSILGIIPKPNGDILLMSLGISQWAVNNPSPMYSPDYTKSYEFLFGQPLWTQPLPLTA